MNYLRFCNLLDKDYDLSITNISLLLSLILVAFKPNSYSACVFVVCSLNYMHKRYEMNKTVKRLEIEDEMKEIKNRVMQFESQLDDSTAELKRVESLHAQVSKQSDEVRSSLQALNLANGLNLQKRVR